jgi:hypothetical protein
MKKLVLIAALIALALPGFALFRAGDIVFILAAANAPGGGGTYWNTDVWVTNPNAVAVKLTIEYLPSGLAGNAANRIYIDWPDTIAAGQTLYIPEIVKNHFASYGAAGAIVLYGEYADGTVANIIATSRTFTPKDTANLALGNYGQGIPGTPWYYYIDPAYASEKYDAHWLFGLDQSDISNTDKYRTNVGFVNGSQDCTLNLKLELYDSAGAKVGESAVNGLGPLAHFQIGGILAANFGISEGSNYSMKISIASSTPANPTFPPALFVYGSKVSNGTGDPTYIEATYSVPINYPCLWP